MYTGDWWLDPVQTIAPFPKPFLVEHQHQSASVKFKLIRAGTKPEDAQFKDLEEN